MDESASPPSTGQLFGDALEHWLAHQGRFWKFAAPGALIVGVVPFITIFGPWPPALWILWVENMFLMNGVVYTLVESLILYQWFKDALYDDWRARRALLLQMDKFPWSAFVGVGFVAFWAAHFLCIFAFNRAWGALALSEMRTMPWIVYIPGEAITAVRMTLLGLVFGSFMLFLPARAADLPWGPLTAFRKAAGLRGRLIVLALLWAAMSLAGAIAVQRLTFYVRLEIYRDGPMFYLLHVASGALAAVIGFVAYYILAHALTRLFIASTGWRPEPLPVPLRLS